MPNILTEGVIIIFFAVVLGYAQCCWAPRVAYVSFDQVSINCEAVSWNTEMSAQSRNMVQWHY